MRIPRWCLLLGLTAAVTLGLYSPRIVENVKERTQNRSYIRYNNNIPTETYTVEPWGEGEYGGTLWGYVVRNYYNEDKSSRYPEYRRYDPRDWIAWIKDLNPQIDFNKPLQPGMEIIVPRLE